MFIELIYKEFKNERIVSENKLASVFSILLKLIFVGLFIALEVYIFLSLDKKITEYSSYGTYDFLIFFLFIMMLISIASSLFKASKVLFNKEDKRLLFPLPISESTIIFSKVTFIYLKEVALNLCISTPLLMAFAYINGYMPYFYIFSLLYPFIIGVFNMGITLILLPLYEILYKLIKTSDIAQFIIALISVIVLCFAYQFVLNLFLNALNNSSIGGVFNKDFIDALHNAIKYFYPINNIFNPIVNSINSISNMCFVIGGVLLIAVVGYNVSAAFYKMLNKKEINNDGNVGKLAKKQIKVISPFKALVKKEFDLLFKDSANVFSYTSLLIMAPFLSYVVISSLNAIIYGNLRIFLIYFPEIINGINITLILLFSSVINASASLSITREEKCIQIIKYLPVSITKQIYAKVLAPLALSSLSLIVTLTTLFATKEITTVVFFVSLIIGLILIVFTNLYGIIFDMHDKGATKYKISYLNSLISLVFPCILLVFQSLMSYLGVNAIINYTVLILMSVCLLIPCFIRLNKQYEKAFNKMEVN